jgi:regulator of PEP synthase PpsR (kinase-PPPase family)
MIAFRPHKMPLLVFFVSDMTTACSAAVVSRAVLAADRAAKVAIDLTVRRVDVKPGAADLQNLTDAITKAGFTPTIVVDSSLAAFASVDAEGLARGGDDADVGARAPGTKRRRRYATDSPTAS